MNPVLRRATDADRRALESLLADARLPVPGPSDIPVEFVVAVDEGRLVGCAGWELHGSSGLLRSVVVAPEWQGKGVGSRLVAEAMRALDLHAVRELFLVTIDRERFFERFGFFGIAKRQVPAAVRASPEFRIHECAGGQWMKRAEPGRRTTG